MKQLRDINLYCKLVYARNVINISCIHEALSKSYFFMKIMRLSASGSSCDSSSSRNGRVPS